MAQIIAMTAYRLRASMIFIVALFFLISSTFQITNAQRSRWGRFDLVDPDLEVEDIPDDYDFVKSEFKEVKFQPFSYHKKYLKNESDDKPYSYDPSDEFGPHNWAKHTPQCGGSRQSPINIDVNSCQHGARVGQMKVTNMNRRPERVVMENNGHSIEFSFEFDSERPILLGGPLKSKYVFEQLHFHWGNRDATGSEHTINSRAAAMEMHLVHRNTKYRNSTIAAQYRDGLAVIGVMFEVSQSTPPLPFLKNLDQLRLVNSNVSIHGRPLGFRMKDFIKTMDQDFLAYQGSLTTPPCSEAVSWLVARHPMKLSPRDILQFRKIFTYNDKLMAPNYRPVQPLNGRFCLAF